MSFDDHELLSAAEEVELAKAIEAGVLAQGVLDGLMPDCQAEAEELAVLVEEGRLARERFWLCNLRLVQSLAMHQAERTGSNLDDLFQEGCLGLAEAIQRWDHRVGTKFSTVAWPWVRHHLQRSDIDQRHGRSRTEVRAGVELRAVAEVLGNQRGGEVGARELAAATSRSTAEVQVLLAPRQVPLTDELLDQQSWLRGDRDARWEGLPEWLGELDDQLAEILTLRYGLLGPERSTAWCARRMRCSESTVRRLERRALDQARLAVARFRGGPDQLPAGAAA